MSHQTHLQTLITYNTRRLQKLKELQAPTGRNTDPAILIEIEDIEAELSQLRKELAVYKSESEQQTQPQVSEEANSFDEDQTDLHYIEANPNELQTKSAILEKPSKHELHLEANPEQVSATKVQIIPLPMGLKNFDLQHKAMLQQLYQVEQRVMVEKEFGGGFGEAEVFLVRPINQHGQSLARQIVKIGLPLALQREQQNYLNYVKKSLPFIAAEVAHFVIWQGLGGIIYNFVGDSRLGQTRTLEDIFLDEHISAEAINRTLTDLLDRALGERWYHQTKLHTCFFDDEYGPHLIEHLRVRVRPASQDGLWLSKQKSDFIKEYRQLNIDRISNEHSTIDPETLVQIEGLVIIKIKPNLLKLQHPTRSGIVIKVETSEATNFTLGQAVTVRGEVRYNRLAQLTQIMTTAFANFPEVAVDPQAETLTWNDQTYPNPLNLYPTILNCTLNGKKSLVHGDLHLRNIMVDESGHGWLIDFALVKERHNLYDFIKLEVYIRQMVLSQPQYEFSFADYLQFEAALLDNNEAEPDDPMLQKAYQVIQKVRELATLYVRDFEAEYLPGLFLYSLAVVKYVDNHGVKAARLAFGTAGVVGGRIHFGMKPKGELVKSQSKTNSTASEPSQKVDTSSIISRYQDLFAPLEIGLEQAGEKIGDKHARYSDFLLYDSRLRENIRRSRRFGNTADRQAERAEIIDQLNELALSTLGVSFNELCRSR